jgi:hypothetical protein
MLTIDDRRYSDTLFKSIQSEATRLFGPDQSYTLKRCNEFSMFRVNTYNGLLKLYNGTVNVHQSHLVNSFISEENICDEGWELIPSSFISDKEELTIIDGLFQTYLNKSRNKCQHILTTGKNKGNVCGKLSAKNNPHYCKVHVGKYIKDID